LALLRHQASVGGVNIVAQWLQQTRGLRAGYIQMSVDVLVVLTAFAVVPPERVLQSVVGAVAIGAILTLNHRPGRYLGV
ncbi:YitT family protein, partial [Hydrogenophaga sp.]